MTQDRIAAARRALVDIYHAAQELARRADDALIALGSGEQPTQEEGDTMAYRYTDKFRGARRDNQEKSAQARELAEKAVESLRRNGATIPLSQFAKRIGVGQTTAARILDELNARDVLEGR